MPPLHRRIPATMATQHPDNASAPYWETDGDGFVSVYEELSECISAYRDLGVEEFMWDWEGKHADEAVMDKLFADFHDFCQKRPFGRDTFLTFRVPNVWHEKGYSLIRALMVILTSEDFARDLKFPARPLFEVILPMTENAEQLLYLQTCYQKLAQFKADTFTHQPQKNNDYLEVIPLIEGVAGQIRIGALLEKYVELHQKNFGFRPPYIRPFLARSDPALVSGLLATVLGVKIALSEISRFSAKTKIPTFPILGTGSLVFRGGLAPDTVADFVRQYGGVRTATIQSAFRYDYPLNQARRAVAELKKELPRRRAEAIAPEEKKVLENIIRQSEAAYQETLGRIVPGLAGVFAAVPRRRERRLHVGFLAYQRNVGALQLPRAINFTAAFYSLGVPPEFIGLGRSLAQLSAAELKLVEKQYPIMRTELTRAGRFVNKDALTLLAKENPAWQTVLDDVATAEKILGITCRPRTKPERSHQDLSLLAVLTRDNPRRLGMLITQLGRLRGSLG